MLNRQIAIVAAIGLFSSAHAADILVPGEQPTIQAGIDAASNGDVVIVAEGEYFENINFNGKAITLRSTDPNNAGVVANTIFNGGGSGIVVACNSGEGSGTFSMDSRSPTVPTSLKEAVGMWKKLSDHKINRIDELLPLRYTQPS